MMSVRSRITAAWVSALSLVGCIPDFDDDSSLVEALSVLAVRADPAEARPGERVTLQGLVVSAAGEASDEALTSLEWGACTARKPLIELGPVAPACIEDFGTDDGALRALGSGREVELQLAPDVCRVFGPLAPPPEPGSDVSGRPVDPDVTGGFYQPLVLGVEEPTLAAVRIACGAANLPQAEAVVFNQGYRANENPHIERLLVEIDGDERTVDGDGEPLVVRPGATVTLRVRLPRCPDEPVCGDGLCTAGENATSCAEDCRTDPRGCGGAEVYLRPDIETRSVVSIREELRVGWFATAGRFDTSQTGTDDSRRVSENRFTAPNERGLVRGWIVLRDDRGGVDFRSFEIDVVR